MGATATVLGASGYSGGEVVRILAGHPAIELAVAAGDAHSGRRLDEVHPQLAGAWDGELVAVGDALAEPYDVVFSCLPSGVLSPVVEDAAAEVIVDLADDFRADASWAYGLTEWARPAVSAARRIANPGCYPTAALLCLLPFAAAGAISGPVIVDAISGVSGAGRRASDHLSFGTISAGVVAYGSTNHRHVPEIERGLARLGGLEATVSFTPHLAPMARGLLVTARAVLETELTDEAALEVLRERYEDEPFIEVRPEWPGTKSLTGSNRAHVSARIDGRNGLLIASAAIDNLGKGAAGQAVQNANLALGIDELAGLESYGVWP